jgi:hypothetical protein
VGSRGRSFTDFVDLSPDSAAAGLHRDRLLDCFVVPWADWW